MPGSLRFLDWSHIQANTESTDAVIQACKEISFRRVRLWLPPGTKSPKPNRDNWFRGFAKKCFTSKDQLLTFGLGRPGPEFTQFGWRREPVGRQLARELDARITVHVGVGSSGQHGKGAKWARPALYGIPDTTSSTAPL